MSPADGAGMEPGRHSAGGVRLFCAEPEASKPALLANNAYPAIKRHALIRDLVRRPASGLRRRGLIVPLRPEEGDGILYTRFMAVSQ